MEFLVLITAKQSNILNFVFKKKARFVGGKKTDLAALQQRLQQVATLNIHLCISSFISYSCSNYFFLINIDIDVPSIKLSIAALMQQSTTQPQS